VRQTSLIRAAMGHARRRKNGRECICRSETKKDEETGIAVAGARVWRVAKEEVPAIEKGIKIPPPQTGFRKYAWDHMEVGDSFWAPVGQTALTRAAAGHSAWRKNDRKYVCRSEKRKDD
jgi:hypothetical protein